MGATLAASLADWIGTALAGPGTTGTEHCVQIRPCFRIPGAGTVDLLTLRHDKSGQDRFRVDLWTILPRPLSESDVDPMLRRLHAFQAWYGDLVEQAELQGFSPGHRLSLRGNLVGTALRRSALLELLAQSGSSLFFWKWRRSGEVLRLAPVYGRAPDLGGARTQLKRLLDHLTWRDAVEDEEQVDRTKAGTL